MQVDLGFLDMLQWLLELLLQLHCSETGIYSANPLPSPAPCTHWLLCPGLQETLSLPSHAPCNTAMWFLLEIHVVKHWVTLLTLSKNCLLCHFMEGAVFQYMEV